MQLDLFYELSVPPIGARTEDRVLHDTLEELELADRLGFGTAWLVEHHFMPGYSHSSAPEVFLAAASQRTRRLRLGHGIIPLPYHHPLQVAERVATLDILSHGRVEVGFGRGFSPREYAVFGASMADSRSRTEESLEVLRAAFRGDPVTFHGRHFDLDEIAVVPRVMQRPHPPLWTAAVSPESFELAARLGVGALAGPFKPWIMVREDLRRYRRHWAHYRGHGAVGPGENRRVGMTVGIFCHPDRRRARALAADAMVWFYQALLDQTRELLERLYTGYEYYRRMAPLRALLERAVSLPLLETLGMAIVGDPEHCIKRLRALQRAGVDRALLAVGAGALPTAQVRASLELIAGRVLPALDAPPAARVSER